MISYDVIVIGAGPGGYIAAIRASQLGFKVACVEGWRTPKGEWALGGTCLNVGCIPSKALLSSSEKYEGLTHHYDEIGISAQGITVDVRKMIAYKDKVVQKNTKGVEFLFKKNKVTWHKGMASFYEQNAEGIVLKVNQADGATETLLGKKIIIATGSLARHLPNIPVDNQLICDNEGALNFDQVPQRLGVIGSGVIGLELGSVWRRLGANVTVLEAMDKFLPAADESVAKEAAKIFVKQGLDIQLGCQISSVQTKDTEVEISYVNNKGESMQLTVDKLVVAVGRVPNTKDLNLQAIGLQVDERGFIPVDHHNQTLVANVYAIGDVVRGPMLAHKAEEEGVYVAELLAGQKPHIDFNTIPWVIYTDPEIAWVGKTEQQLKAEGRATKVGQFPFMANGRALSMGKAEGFVKIIADAKTDEVLGAHIIGHNASDLIAELVMAMEFRASSEDIARICHAHPTLSEVVKEAALAVDGRALNM